MFLSEFMLIQHSPSSASKQVVLLELQTVIFPQDTLTNTSVVSVQLELNYGDLMKLWVLCGYLLDSDALI